MKDQKVEEKGRRKKFDLPLPIKGVITARKCEYCQHNEIGITTEKGRYVRLDPGMKVELIEK